MSELTERPNWPDNYGNTSCFCHRHLLCHQCAVATYATATYAVTTYAVVVHATALIGNLVTASPVTDVGVVIDVWRPQSTRYVGANPC